MSEELICQRDVVVVQPGSLHARCQRLGHHAVFVVVMAQHVPQFMDHHHQQVNISVCRFVKKNSVCSRFPQPGMDPNPSEAIGGP